ncbi:MAG: ATP-binding protein [Clostridia bacterium]|nr:ATP-binding protein [Clostridia bacterium]
MENIRLKKLYLRLCMTSIFHNVLKNSVFSAFEAYAKSESIEEKLKAYSSMVTAIYENGGTLDGYLRKAIFEDENIYVKQRARKIAIDKKMEKAVTTELDTFSEFTALSAEDFKNDLGIDLSIPEFNSRELDLNVLYHKRIEEIDKYGYGVFSSSPMFRLSDSMEIEPVVSADKISLEKFIGYKEERQRVIDNTEAFLQGRPAANVLLCGDAGTGKSSTVKAVANEFFNKGIRLIELRKDQLSALPYVMGKISENPLKFIIFIDDLSFNKNDDNFSMLKAALEGSASAKAENAVIYATSNRRHIVKESFQDREGSDIHRNDTIQETLSLSERFGLTVLFSKPDKKLYLEIIHELAERSNIKCDYAKLDIDAEAFALRRGYRSARCAEQFINSLL